METLLDIPVLEPEEKVIGSAYLTQDGEIVFNYQHDTTEVLLVKPKKASAGPWAVRQRPPRPTRAQHAGA